MKTTHKFIHFAQPVFGPEEKKEVLAALDSGWVTLGPRVKQFEEEYAASVGAKYAIGVNSCTAALHLALLAVGVQPGDEVITTVFTFAATPNTIIQCGAKPVFVDIDPKTMNFDYDKVEKAITKKTKAIVSVDYGGQPCDYDRLKEIAKKYNLKIVEDAACASGAEYKGKKIGSVADITCFSFHPIKNISTGDGGMITTDNEEYATTCTLLRLQGMSKEAWKRYTAGGSWKYDILMPGFKYNMTDIAAALGIQQLKKLDKFVAIRYKYAEMYDKAFSKVPEITIPYMVEYGKNARNIYTIQVETSQLKITRDEMIDALKEAGIGVSVYYIPLNQFSYYQKAYGYKVGQFPMAEYVYERMMSLPMSPKMTVSDVKYIIKTVSDLVVKNRK